LWNSIAPPTEYPSNASDEPDVRANSSVDRVADDELVQQTAAGDADAFAALYRRRRPDVFRFTLHMTGDTSVAEDVAQDVFVAVMRDAARFQTGRATVAAWLCGIARNLLRQRFARDRRLEPLAQDADSLDMPSVPPGALSDLLQAERLDTLRRAVLSLPLRYREAVVLCDLQELPYAEAAEALACAVGTLRSRLHRARALLAAKMLAAARTESASVAGSTDGRAISRSTKAGTREPGAGALEREGWMS
jgi:RNA polymerase sigma-70 factor, ECF subfamily